MKLNVAKKYWKLGIIISITTAFSSIFISCGTQQEISPKWKTPDNPKAVSVYGKKNFDSQNLKVDFRALSEGKKLIWEREKLNLIIKQGQTEIVPIKLISSEDIENAEFWLTPSLKGIAEVIPQIRNIIKGENIIKLKIYGSEGTYSGTLHIRQNKKTISEPLQIEIHIITDRISNEAEELCEDFEKGGLAGEAEWKGWREWRGQKPSFNEIAERGIFGMSVSFVPIWEFGKEEPNSPDGFLVVHVGAITRISIPVEIKLSECIRMYGENELTFDVEDGGNVKSMYVALKMKDKGTFIISVVSPFQSKYLYIVREGRRKIKILSPEDYLRYLWDNIISNAQKRSGAEYYSPKDIAIQAQEGVTVPEVNVYVDEIGEFKAEPVIIPEIDFEYEDTATHIETWETAREGSEEQYTFRGYVVFYDPYGKRYLPAIGATINVFDDDDLNADDFICSATVSNSGYFECQGKAYDFLSKPDPYVIASPINSKIVVDDCSTAHQQYVVKLHDFGPLKGGIYWVGAQDKPKVIPEIFRNAYWVLRLAYLTYIKGGAGELSKTHQICYPHSRSFYSQKERKTFISYECAESSLCSIGTFGFSVLHELYEYGNLPLGSMGFMWGICVNPFVVQGKRNSPEAKGFAFTSGFSIALAMKTFETSYVCSGGGEPDKCYPSPEDLEPSTSIREPFVPYQSVANNIPDWHEHLCDKRDALSFLARRAGIAPFSYENPGYVASAIWDLYDPLGESGSIDESCSFHRNQRRYPCDATGIGWDSIIKSIKLRKPKDFTYLVLYLIWNDIVINRQIERTVKFNGIETIPQTPRDFTIEVVKKASYKDLEEYGDIIKRVKLKWIDASGVESEFVIRAEQTIQGYKIIKIPSVSENNDDTFLGLEIEPIEITFEDEIRASESPGVVYFEGFPWLSRIGMKHCYDIVAEEGKFRSPSRETQRICVPNELPEAFLRVIDGIAPLTITLDASGSYDPDGIIVAYIWDCGNGIRGMTVPVKIQEVNVQVGDKWVCSYTTGGTYKVSVSVVDDEGDIAEVSETVRVEISALETEGQLPSPYTPESDGCSIGFNSTSFLLSGIFYLFVFRKRKISMTIKRRE